MPRPDTPPLTRSVVIRGLGFGLAIALGAVAVWLIVTGSMSPRRIEIGVLAGLWGLLLGAYTMFGARRNFGETLHYVTSAELEVRSGGGLEPAAQAEARRAFEERLEHLLRTEISTAVSREVGDLRREVASLRKELLEKVGGELRLERIETTRLIGSDLEALQHEVRALKSARDGRDPAGINGARSVVDSSAIPVAAERVDAAAAARAIEEQAAAERRRADAARAEQAARERAAYDNASRERAAREQAEREKAQRERAQREKAQREQAERDRAQRQQAERERAQRETAQRQQAVREQAARERAAREQAAREQAQREEKAKAKAAAARAEQERLARAEQAARDKAAAEQAARDKAAAELAEQQKTVSEQTSTTNGASDDPFASLPRIRPFTDFELDPIEVPVPPAGAQSDDEPTYTGRRRANGADAEDAGRHSRHSLDSEENGGRRRRHEDDDEGGIDLLSQLLSRGPADR